MITPRIALLVAIFWMVNALPAPAQGEETIVYRPPLRGAPTARIGGGTRGLSKDDARVILLAPAEVGYTFKEQPDLYWFIDKPVKARLEVSLTGEKEIKPLLETTVTVSKAGVQRLSLAKLGVSLQAGQEYEWFVALVNDEKQRSGDLVSGGAIKRVPLPQELKSKLTSAPADQAPLLYADSGYWYDAIAALSDLSEKHPTEQRYQKWRNDILLQAGLDVGEGK